MRWPCFWVLLLPLLAAAQEIDHWETVIYASDEWHYLLPGPDTDTLWRFVDFDDSQWLKGPGGIGYGDDDDQTVIPPSISVWMRRAFSLERPERVRRLVLNMDYDDAYVAYLNGVEIARANIGSPGQPPAFDAPANGLREAQMYQGGTPEYVIWDEEQLESLLRPGKNVLAIQVHNESPNSSDLSAIPFLTFGVNDSERQYGAPPPWFVPPVPISETFESHLPIVVIDTEGRPILDEPRIHARMGIVYQEAGGINRLRDGFNHYEGDISIEIRGSSSQFFPKKQYGLETQKPDGSNHNVSLLGMPKENDWILYAPYSDKSLIRNILTYKLGRDLGRYAPRTRLCELVLNDEYMGVYVLMEKIKRDKNRVNIDPLTPEEVSGEDLTGGYIIKIDRSQGDKSWFSPHLSAPGSPARTEFVYAYPKSEDIAPEQQAYIRQYITDFENALKSEEFMDRQRGYLPFIDLPSFVDFFLMNELTRNVDAYRLSAFMHKDKGGKLMMGPLWDFNLAFGNADYCEGGQPQGWQFRRFNQICAGDAWINPFWWERLTGDTLFCQAVNARWQALRESTFSEDRIHALIDSLTAELAGAQERNFERWPVLGQYVWPNNFVGNSYQAEITYLKNWISQRLKWIDQNLSGICTYVEPLVYAHKQLEVYPNPFSEEVHFAFSLKRYFDLRLEMFDLAGRRVAVLMHGIHPRGNYRLKWDPAQAEGAGWHRACMWCACKSTQRLLQKK